MPGIRSDAVEDPYRAAPGHAAAARVGRDRARPAGRRGKRLMDFCITHSRLESNKEEEEKYNSFTHFTNTCRAVYYI